MTPIALKPGGPPVLHVWNTQRASVQARLQGPRRCARQLLVAAVSAADTGADKHMFIFGLGYTAVAIGNQLQKLGW